MEKNDPIEQENAALKYRLELHMDMLEALKELRAAEEDYQGCIDDCKSLKATEEDFSDMNDAKLLYEVKKQKLYALLDEYQIKKRFMESL